MRPKHRGLRIGVPPRTTADAVEAAIGSSEASERLMSLSQAGRLLGRDRGTLRGWIDKGMPVESAGGTGEATVVDLKKVVEWREEQARLEERERYAKPATEGPDGRPMTTKDMIELEKLASLSMKNGKDAEFLVPRPHVEAAFERALGIIRISVMAVPERLVREMAGFPDDKKLVWREKALKSCRAALAEGAAALTEALPGFEPPAVE